ncbi:MAG: XisH family protein [Bacteroidetes bacterium]|nr:XisH family protein [Bacteroidota bacterium]MCB0841780.1 XisH family protein [Bacteroidota bacterium]
MSAKDIYHDHVREALKNDGWTITDDPYSFSVGKVDFRIDLGAEKLLAAEKGNHKIAVEIKSFIKASPVQDMHEAVGKYEIYSLALDFNEPERELYLAIPKRAYDSFFQRPFIQALIKHKKIKLIVYRLDKTEISTWIK